jgi:DNA adenine methylase
MPRRRPHPIPYQGSKRHLADTILAFAGQRRFRRFIEPFAGSAAMTIAAADRRVAEAYVIGDSLAPLARIWTAIMCDPESLVDAYEQLWHAQRGDERAHFDRIRDEFNRDREPARLLYLLVRCVKNSPRFDARGHFNQSPDNRRRGMRPTKMRREILGAARLLAARTTVRSGDYRETLEDVGPDDLVYLDPPWQGTSMGPHKRYHSGLRRSDVLELVSGLNRRGVPFLLSYDGRSGNRTYGEPLPETRFELNAGRSSQATLNGRNDVTVESLYVSARLLVAR